VPNEKVKIFITQRKRHREANLGTVKWTPKKKENERNKKGREEIRGER